MDSVSTLTALLIAGAVALATYRFHKSSTSRIVWASLSGMAWAMVTYEMMGIFLWELPT